jgi:hypothetical protein
MIFLGSLEYQLGFSGYIQAQSITGLTIDDESSGRRDCWANPYSPPISGTDPRFARVGAMLGRPVNRPAGGGFLFFFRPFYFFVVFSGCFVLFFLLVLVSFYFFVIFIS